VARADAGVDPLGVRLTPHVRTRRLGFVAESSSQTNRIGCLWCCYRFSDACVAMRMEHTGYFTWTYPHEEPHISGNKSVTLGRAWCPLFRIAVQHWTCSLLQVRVTLVSSACRLKAVLWASSVLEKSICAGAVSLHHGSRSLFKILLVLKLTLHWSFETFLPDLCLEHLILHRASLRICGVRLQTSNRRRCNKFWRGDVVLLVPLNQILHFDRFHCKWVISVNCLFPTLFKLFPIS